MEHLLRLWHQFLKAMMCKDQWLEMDVQMFFRRKNEVVRKLYLAIEILAATLGTELYLILLRQAGFMPVPMLMLVLMSLAMSTRLRRVDEATPKMVIFSAIVELHIPTHRDEEHHKGHQEGPKLQDSFFHGAKIQKIFLNG